MTRFQRLKSDAMFSCRYREHTMSKFKTLAPGIARAFCRRCGKEMQVEVNPAPNSIDIGGEAVALHCSDPA